MRYTRLDEKPCLVRLITCGSVLEDLVRLEHLAFLREKVGILLFHQVAPHLIITRTEEFKSVGIFRVKFKGLNTITRGRTCRAPAFYISLVVA